MSLSVSNSGIERSLDFLPESVTLTAKNVVPRNDNIIPRKSSGSLKLVVDSKARTFEQPSSASSN